MSSLQVHVVIQLAARAMACSDTVLRWHTTCKGQANTITICLVIHD